MAERGKIASDNRNQPDGEHDAMETGAAEVKSGSTRLNEWLQVAGLFGVIASLMFVGLQMKQQQEIALSAAT